MAHEKRPGVKNALVIPFMSIAVSHAPECCKNILGLPVKVAQND